MSKGSNNQSKFIPQSGKQPQSKTPAATAPKGVSRSPRGGRR